MGLLTCLKLGGTGFSGHRIGCPPHRGTRTNLDHLAHEMCQKLCVIRRHQGSIGGRKELLDRLTTHIFNMIDHIWLHQRAAVGDRRYDHQVMQRRNLGFPLSDRGLKLFPVIRTAVERKRALVVRKCVRKLRIKEHLICQRPEFF